MVDEANGIFEYLNVLRKAQTMIYGEPLHKGHHHQPFSVDHEEM